ncbi:hypothetical protein CHUAL_000389 [Chamberlinius hualienensis]
MIRVMPRDDPVDLLEESKKAKESAKSHLISFAVLVFVIRLIPYAIQQFNILITSKSLCSFIQIQKKNIGNFSAKGNTEWMAVVFLAGSSLSLPNDASVFVTETRIPILLFTVIWITSKHFAFNFL